MAVQHSTQKNAIVHQPPVADLIRLRTVGTLAFDSVGRRLTDQPCAPLPLFS